MRKLSPKNSLLAIFLAIGVLILYSCIVPVGQLEKFLEDDTVQAFIGNVIVDPASDDGLTGRNGRIDGLDAAKYYMVEKEFDAAINDYADGYPKYVMTDTTSKDNYGILTSELGEITTISGGRITGLTNANTYTVYAATPPSSVALLYTDDNGNHPITISDGIINITNPEGDCKFALSGVFGTGGDYIAIPITESRTNYTAGHVTTTPVSQKAGTTVDYVFSDDTPANFKVLRVVIGNGVISGTIQITINLSMVNGSLTLTPSSHTFNQSDFATGQTQTITVDSSGIGASSGVVWWYNGNQLVTGATLTLRNDETGLGFGYLAAGTHVFTVVVTIDGIPYSADFTLTVSP